MCHQRAVRVVRNQSWQRMERIQLVDRQAPSRSAIGINELPNLELPGGGEPPKVHEVVALTKANSQKFVFLSKTRQTSVNIERSKQRLGLKGLCGVDCDGRGEGLAFFVMILSWT
jgi:hypothetical protein